MPLVYVANAVLVPNTPYLPSEIVVALAIASHMNAKRADGDAWPSVQLLMSITGLGEAAVRRAVRVLCGQPARRRARATEPQDAPERPRRKLPRDTPAAPLFAREFARRARTHYKLPDARTISEIGPQRSPRSIRADLADQRNSEGERANAIAFACTRTSEADRERAAAVASLARVLQENRGLLYDEAIAEAERRIDSQRRA